MDKETLSILLSFSLYCVYFLVPLIPAILIYKIFPETAVSTSGSLANFKINSSGAFAAYLATVLIGIWALSDTQGRILEMKNPIAPTWTIKGKIELKDFDRKPVKKPQLFENVCVTVKPKIFNSANGHIHFRIPGTFEGKVPQRLVTIEVVGFGKGDINLTTIEKEGPDRVEINYRDQIIDYKKPIEIIAMNPNNQEPYTKSEHIEPTNR